jgi:hypothetical protein
MEGQNQTEAPEAQTNMQKWKDHYGGLAEAEEQKETYNAWKGHYGVLADLQEEKENYVEEKKEPETVETEEEQQTNANETVNIEKERLDQIYAILLEIKDSLKDRNQDTNKIDLSNEGLGKNPYEIDISPEDLAEENTPIDINPEDLEETPAEENAPIDINPEDLNETPAEENTPIDINPEDLDETPAEENAPIDINPEDLDETPAEENAPIDINPEDLVEENTQEQEQTPEEERTGRMAKLYKTIADVLKVHKVVPALAGFAGGAVVGGAVLSSSILWLPVVVIGGVMVSNLGQNLSHSALGKLFKESEFENTTGAERTPAEEEEIKRRKENLKKLRESSVSFFRGGAWGAIVGGAALR